jgi:hypothetical protein
MDAMEICNFGCVIVGYADYVPMAYDEMLRYGERIFCLATDDNHNRHPEDSVYCDSFGGWVAIKADAATPYKVVKKMMSELQDMSENRYYLITSLKKEGE